MFKLSRLDPRTKMVIVATVSTGVLILGDIRYLAGILGAMVLLLAFGGVSLSKQCYQARGILGMVVFLFVLQWIFGGKEGLLLASMLSLRLLIIVLSGMLLLTGEPRDYLLGLVQMKVPYEIAFMVMVGLHFFPSLKEEALDVYHSIQLRGTEMKKTTLTRKLRTYLKICLPILAGALERARDTATAMEARCFRRHPQRTYMRRLHLRAKDITVMIVVPLAICTVVLGGCGKLDGVHAGDIKTPDQIVLSWTGDSATTQTVSWHGDTSYQGMVQANGKEFKADVKDVRNGEYFRYTATMTGLLPGTTYTYRVGDGHTWSDKHHFTTEKSGDFSFLFMGDVQYELMDRDYKQWGQLVDLAHEKNPHAAFVLQAGDMVNNNAALDEYATVMNYGEPLFASVSLMPAPGNHETSVTPFTYEELFSVPGNGSSKTDGEVYSFDYGNCHIVSLNSSLFLPERKEDMGKQKWKAMMRQVDRWIKKDLSQSDAEWKIVFMHHPPYPVSEDIDVYGLIRKEWVPTFEKSGVDLVLCGHQHIYMRTKPIDGITYIMGRSGEKYSRYYEQGDPIPRYVAKLKEVNSYEVVQVKSDSLSVVAYDASGKPIDRWIKN